MEVRYGAKFAGTSQAARLGETIALGDARVTLKPAGHVLGSAQVLIEVKGARVVVSGDYKRARDPTCPPFEPSPCDVFITEATFGLPVFRHPPARGEVAKLLHSLTLFPGARAFRRRLFARQGTAPDRVDPRSRLPRSDLRRRRDRAPLCRLCRVQCGFGRAPAARQSNRERFGRQDRHRPALRARTLRGAEREPITSFASGWMRTRKRARAGGGELPLDHLRPRRLGRTDPNRARDRAPRTLDHPRRGSSPDPLGEDERHRRPPARDQRLRRRRGSRRP